MAIFKSKTPYVGLPTNEYVYKLPQATKKTSRPTGVSKGYTKEPVYSSIERFLKNADRNLTLDNVASADPGRTGYSNSGSKTSTTPTTPKASSGGSSGGGYSSGGSSTVSSTVSTPRYDAAYDRAMAQQKRAYDRAMAEYNQAKAAYQAYYDKLARQRKANLDATLQANNSSADKSAQDAYVAYMNNLKNLPQQLRNAGVSGGGSETTIADITNTYQNNRNNIMTNRDNNNSRAQLAYSQGLASDYGDYINNVNSLTVPTMGDITVNAGTTRSKSTTKSSGSSGTGTTKSASTGTTKSTSSGTNSSGTSKTNSERLSAVAANGNSYDTTVNLNGALSTLYRQYAAAGLSDSAIRERLKRLGIIK